MGVYKRKGTKKTTWFYRFIIDGERYYESGFQTWREARNAEIAKEQKVRVAKKTGIFADLVARRKAQVEAYCTPTHARDNRAMLRRFDEWLELPVPEISAALVQDKLLDLKKKGLSNHNVNRHLRALRATFQLAIKEGKVFNDPTSGIPFMPVEKPVKYVPTKADVSKALLKCSPIDRAYITVAWLTGARIGEINRLKWEDINLEEGILRLWTRKKKFGNKSSRVVPMVAPVRAAIEYAWKHRAKGSPWVFTNRMMVKKYPGEPERWCYQYRDKLIKRIAADANRPFTYHNLRHSAASILASLHADLTTIQSILGHESATTTNRYLQSMPQGVITAMGALEKEVVDVFD